MSIQIKRGMLSGDTPEGSNTLANGKHDSFGFPAFAWRRAAASVLVLVDDAER